MSKNPCSADDIKKRSNEQRRSLLLIKHWRRILGPVEEMPLTPLVETAQWRASDGSTELICWIT